MTDNEIIKALECCSNAEPCENCPYQKQCDETDLAEIALDIINRQKAEIERKEKELEAFARWDKEYQTEIYELKKSLLSKENLEESFSKSVKQFDKKLARTVKLERAEAIKEFAERLRNSAYESEVVAFIGKVYMISETAIKNAIKETAGAENG